MLNKLSTKIAHCRSNDWSQLPKSTSYLKHKKNITQNNVDVSGVTSQTIISSSVQKRKVINLKTESNRSNLNKTETFMSSLYTKFSETSKKSPTIFHYRKGKIYENIRLKTKSESPIKKVIQLKSGRGNQFSDPNSSLYDNFKSYLQAKIVSSKVKKHSSVLKNP